MLPTDTTNTQTIAQLQAHITRLEQENRKLKRLVAIDPLTQVANRKTFEHRLQDEWKRARRNHSVVSLLILEIDQFRKVTRKHGPAFSHSLLQRLVFTLSRIPRRSADLFARYGNQEFAIILPDTPAQGARKLAEIVLQRAHLCDMTVSIGVATAIPSQSDFRQLVGSAVQALSQAKQQGGNCLIEA